MTLAYFAAALLALHLSTKTESIAPLWPSAAILLVCLVRNPVATWPVFLVLGVAADMAAGFVMGGGLRVVAVVAGADVLEALLVATALHRLMDNGRWFLSVRWISLFAIFSLLAAALAGIVGTFLLGSQPGTYVMPWHSWMITDALSLTILSPFLLCWTEPVLRRGFTFSRTIEALVLSAFIGGISYYACTRDLPLLSLVFPFLMLMTLRAGLGGATMGTVTVSCVAVWYTVHGSGPFAMLGGFDAMGRIMMLQLYLVAVGLSTIPFSINLTLREQLESNLKQEHSISAAALDNMVQGLCMFDADQRLITCNERYADIYHLPPQLVAPGTLLADILQHRVAGGSAIDAGEEFVRDRLAAAHTSRDHSEVELLDGTIIDIHRRLLPDGGWVATHEDVTERRRATHRIAYLANHDPLTDLPNRAFFGEQLQKSLSDAERGNGFALHSLDLDHFKEVNDTLGHSAGDELLRQVAERLRRTVKEAGFVSRLGGDEFAILQFRLDEQEDAHELASELVAQLSQPYLIGGQEVVIGASVGIAIAPGDTLDSASLLQKSDLALYRAKADGRSTHRFFKAGMDDLVQARRVMEIELRAAVQKGEFELYYQPTLNLETGAIGSFEALLRWRHPIRGIINPIEFVPLAEDTGLIVPIGEWVLRQACREAANWPANIKVAVNLSPVQFKDRNLVQLVVSALTAAELSPHQLELEVTESVLMQDNNGVLTSLRQLRALGISIAMDDFGTGYSSLSYLRRFPFDKIKIDRSFIADLDDTKESLAIIHATLELSDKLGMTMTAEGVETAEQLALLRAEGCMNIQGYYISRPVPANRVLPTLDRYPGSHILASARLPAPACSRAALPEPELYRPPSAGKLLSGGSAAKQKSR